jgi:hypothetical protein
MGQSAPAFVPSSVCESSAGMPAQQIPTIIHFKRMAEILCSIASILDALSSFLLFEKLINFLHAKAP